MDLKIFKLKKNQLTKKEIKDIYIFLAKNEIINHTNIKRKKKYHYSL